MSNVKRILSVLLILALALMSFGGLSGCQTQAKSDEPIRILVDGCIRQRKVNGRETLHSL